MTPARAGRDRDWTDAESEGQPVLEEQPPGIGPETAEEGLAPPADHPLAAEEFGVTEREELTGETVAERSRRERPDRPQARPEDPGGRVSVGGTDPVPEDAAGWAGDDQGLSAEEAAVHVDEA